MKNLISATLLAWLFLFNHACRKINLTPRDKSSSSYESVLYTIPQGQHFSNNNDYREIETGEFKFSVQFDSSAIYKTILEENQEDVNKLYGFSDNSSQHHNFSARFGWRWSDEALRMFAYIYNDGLMSYKEIGIVQIGAQYTCSIIVKEGHYIFRLNDLELEMPRTSSTEKAIGFKLYPYFGGDETAPHDTHIRLRDL